ncbi:MAG: EF-hand domain-containing protein [Novosphingobium sp.]
MRKKLLILSAATLGLIGSAVAAQPVNPMADKTVTRAEAEAKASEHFAKMDVNKDGKLDKADREARQAEHFKKMDTDGNGSISQAEFAAAHAAKGEGKGMRHGGQHQGAQGGMPHEGMGAGGHGGPGKGMRHGGKHGKRGGMMMHMADANKDGAISRDEFVGGALKHFDMADANKDGKVTPEERKAAHQKMREHMKQMRDKMGAMRQGTPPPPPAQ